MGLRTTANADNCQLIEGKSVTYAVQKIQQEFTKVMLNIEETYWFAYEYRRFCTMRYKYVGMSYAAAVDKQNQLINLYTRSYKVTDWDKYKGKFFEQPGGRKLMADVQVVKDRGHMYNIEVVINEEDMRIRETGDYNVEALFAAENARSYEEY